MFILYLDQEKELKQFREQIREQFKQIKRDFDSPYNGPNNAMFVNSNGKSQFSLSSSLILHADVQARIPSKIVKSN